MPWGLWWKLCLEDDLLEDNNTGGGVSASADNHHRDEDEDTMYNEILPSCDGFQLHSDEDGEDDTKGEHKKGFQCIHFGKDEQTGTFYPVDNYQRQIWNAAMSHLFESPPSDLDCSVSTTNECCNTLKKNGETTSEITWLRRISQRETWDCGVACLQMLLQWIRDSNLQVDDTIVSYETHNEDSDW